MPAQHVLLVSHFKTLLENIATVILQHEGLTTVLMNVDEQNTLQVQQLQQL
jgi:hypothetical protein